MLRTWTSPKKRQERRDLYIEAMEDVKRGVQAAGDAVYVNGEFEFALAQKSLSFPCVS
jgi:hypothetical protein